MGEWDKEVRSMVGEYSSGGLKIMITRKDGVAVMNRKAYIVGRRNNLRSSYHLKAKGVMRGKIKDRR